MVIDAHVHVWSMDAARYPWQPILGYVPDRPASVDMMVELLDGAGVDRAVLVQPSVYGWDHSYLFHALERFPGRFVGVGLLDHEDPGWRRRLNGLLDRGLVGVRFNLVRDPGRTWINDRAYQALWPALVDHQLSVSFQTRYDHLPAVDVLARTRPAMIIVVDHFGRPELDLGPRGWSDVLRLAARPNVYLKISSFHTFGHPQAWARFQPLLEDCLHAFGADRLMWGSDAPGALKVVGYGSTMEPIQALALADQDRAAVMGGTAAEVFLFGQRTRQRVRQQVPETAQTSTEDKG